MKNELRDRLQFFMIIGIFFHQHIDDSIAWMAFLFAICAVFAWLSLKFDPA